MADAIDKIMLAALQKIDVGPEERQEAETLEFRLLALIEEIEKHGDTEQTRHDKSRLYESINDLARRSGVPICKIRGKKEHYTDRLISSIKEYCSTLPYLTLSSLGMVDTVDSVYVELDAKRQKSEGLGGKERLDGRDSVPLTEVVRTEPMFTVLGTPGSGKSTLLRYIALNAYSSPEKLGIDSPHIPILLSAKELSKQTGSFSRRASNVLASELPVREDLPHDIFQPGVLDSESRFMFLIDGIDEIAESKRNQFLNWLKTVLNEFDDETVILTCRSSFYSDLVSVLQKVPMPFFEIRPLGPEQVGDLIKKLVPGRVEQFTKELTRVKVSLKTPLLVTIAAAVFRNKGRLPRHRASLYATFVEISVQEFRERLSGEDLQQRVVQLTPNILSVIAAMQKSENEELDLRVVSDGIATYLAEVLSVHIDEAEALAEKCVDILSRKSGIVVRRGSIIEFVHPTFREYLTSKRKVRLLRQSISDLHLWLCDMLEGGGEQREILRFALGIIEEEKIDISAAFIVLAKMVGKILYPGLDPDDESDLAPTEGAGKDIYSALEAVTTLALCASDGLSVASGAKDVLLDHLTHIIQELEKDGSLSEYFQTSIDPFLAMAQMPDHPKTTEYLRSRVYAANVRDESRYRATEALFLSGQQSTDDVAMFRTRTASGGFCDDLGVDIVCRLRAIRYLQDRGEVQAAVSYFTSLIESSTSHAYARHVIEFEEAYEFLSSLPDNVVVDSRLLMRCIHILNDPERLPELARTLFSRKPLRSAATDALIAITRDDEIDPWIQCEAAIALMILGAEREARRSLRVMVTEHVDSYAVAYLRRELDRLEQLR